MSKFKIQYDDRPDEIVTSINFALAKHGLEIVETEDADEEGGYQEYEIIRFLPDGK